jgi:copper homeostasis protein CutC
LNPNWNADDTDDTDWREFFHYKKSAQIRPIHIIRVPICIAINHLYRVQEPFEALEAVIACGFSTILTSGQHKTAVSGIAQLQKIIEKAKDRIAILPGGGVRSTNIAQLKKALDTEYYHSSAILDGTEIADKHEIAALKQGIKS